MYQSPRTVRFVLACVFAVLASALMQAHTFVGVLDAVNARARVQSPNANVVDLPIPIPGTALSVACFKVRNTSPFDSRITAIGIDGSEHTSISRNLQFMCESVTCKSSMIHFNI